MDQPITASLFFMAVMAFASPDAADKPPCASKPAGTYCVGDQIVTCTGNAHGTPVACPATVGKDDKPAAGRCFSTGPADNKASCTPPAPAGPCTGKAPGTYCVGEMIMTCKGTAQGTAVGCDVAVGKDGKQLIGRCVSTGPNDNKASCQTTTAPAPAPAGPCSGKAPGTYCVGELIMKCNGTPQGTAVGCDVAIGKDGKQLIGRCSSTGPTDNKAVCKMGQ